MGPLNKRNTLQACKWENNHLSELEGKHSIRKVTVKPKETDSTTALSLICHSMFRSPPVRITLVQSLKIHPHNTGKVLIIQLHCSVVEWGGIRRGGGQYGALKLWIFTKK